MFWGTEFTLCEGQKHFLSLCISSSIYCRFVSPQIWAIKAWRVPSAAECGWEVLSMRSTSHLRMFLKGIKAAWKVLILSPAIEKKKPKFSTAIRLQMQVSFFLIEVELYQDTLFVPYMRSDLGEWLAVLMLYFIPKLKGCLELRLHFLLLSGLLQASKFKHLLLCYFRAFRRKLVELSEAHNAT